MIVSRLFMLIDIFDKLVNEDFDDLNTAYTVAMNIQNLNVSKQMLDTKRRSFIDKYGQKDDNGELVCSDNGSIQIVDMESFTKEWDAFINQDLESIVVKPIKFSHLQKANVKLSVSEILALGDLLVQDTEG